MSQVSTQVSSVAALLLVTHLAVPARTPVRLGVYICSLAPIFTTISVLGINPGHSHHTVCGASRSGLSHAPCPPRWNSARCPHRAHWRITLHTNSGAGLIAVGHPLPCATLGTKARRGQEFHEHNLGSPPQAR